MPTATIRTVTCDDRDVTMPTTPLNHIVKPNDGSSSNNATDNNYRVRGSPVEVGRLRESNPRSTHCELLPGRPVRPETTVFMLGEDQVMQPYLRGSGAL